MRKNTWTEDEILFLKEKFSTKGMNFCSNELGYPKSKISRMSHKLKLKINKDIKEKYHGKPNKECNINPDLFYNITMPEVAYFLGLLWTDGFIQRRKNNSHLGIKNIKDDIISIKDVLNKIGKWNYFEIKKRKDTWKDQIQVSTNNKRIYDFLVEHDYNKKSYASADKILRKIPENLHHYFFRGIVDGDGCFYYKKTVHSTMRQFSVSSTYEQDWEYFENLCKKLNIIYSIKKYKRIKSSYSQIRITNKNGIQKIGEYIYNCYNKNKIGLYRKYTKYQLIMNSPFTHTKFEKYNNPSFYKRF
jgi:hypothetical protein